MFRKITYTFIVCFLASNSFSQNNSGEIHGDFDLNTQSYQEDELIGISATATSDVVRVSPPNISASVVSL